MSTEQGLLRRRGKLEPLADVEDRNLQQIGQEQLFIPVYVSPCKTKVSNDPFQIDLQDFLDEVSRCNETSYRCPRDRANDLAGATNSTLLPLLELMIKFDFEVWVKEGSDIEATLKDLEGVYLEHIAALTGLLSCSQIAIVRGDTGNRRLQSLLTEQEQEALYGIASKPDDEPDPYHTDCIVPVRSAVSDGAECTPVNGALTVLVDPFITGEVEDGLDRGIMRTIRSGMYDDVYVSGNVKKVSFIGERIETGYVDANAAKGYDNQSDGNGLSVIGISFICVGSVLILALAALFVTKRRQRRKEEERNMIFHDATVGARELQAANDEPPFKVRTIEGADIPGSLANEDELALKPGAVGVLKTGNFEEESLASSDPNNVTMPESPDSGLSAGGSPDYYEGAQEYVSDTQSFGPDLSNDLSSIDDTTITTVDQSFEGVRADEIIAELSFDGVKQEDIMDRLNVIAEAEEDLVTTDFDEDDDSVHRLHRAAPYST